MTMKKPKILDCTLRDGGYYTDWDFDKTLVDQYLLSVNRLPIDIIEVGYRSPKLDNYYGEYFYCSTSTLQKIRNSTKKKVAIILNEKDVSLQNLGDLLLPIIDYVDIVRIAVSPDRIVNAIELSKSIKRFDFQVAINVMYMSKWDSIEGFYDSLELADGTIDYFYLVDSYGSIFPEDVKRIVDKVKRRINCKVGFHGHNNLELALSNSITAMFEGIDIIDSTFTGMGRGAGNLKTELLLTVLGQRKIVSVDYDALSNIVGAFSELKDRYKWGTSLPYMLSGALSFPQKIVMNWIGNNFIGLNTISESILNSNIPNSYLFKNISDLNTYENIVIVGGGVSVLKYFKEICEFSSKEKCTLLFVSGRYAELFSSFEDCEKIFILTSDEINRVEPFINVNDKRLVKFVVSARPWSHKISIPSDTEDQVYELNNSIFSGEEKDRNICIALDTLLQIKPNKIFSVGLDGLIQDRPESATFNESCFMYFNEQTSNKMISLTKTAYRSLIKSSIFNP